MVLWHHAVASDYALGTYGVRPEMNQWLLHLDRYLEKRQTDDQGRRCPMFELTHEVVAYSILADWEREANAIARSAEAKSHLRGLRARSASRLAHLALALHHDAAVGAGLRPEEDHVMVGHA